MRKRAQRKSKPEYVKPKHIEQKKPEVIEKKPKLTKNFWVTITLIGIFLLVLFFNSFFNVTSNVAINEDNKGFEKYFLSGPDPYYNLRLVKITYESGEYPFYADEDPLLNYPLGRTGGGRAPLFVMSSFAFSRVLTPFMDEVDAIGISTQFVPALFGALLVFPVYFIGKTIFDKKAGLIAAFILAIIPIHIGSGHGSAYSLFDHDSFNLLMFFLTFLFLILSIKEKDSKKSVLYALLSGIPLAGLTMVWVEAQFLYVIIAAYAIIQMIFDIFLNKIDIRVFRSVSIILLTGYIVSMPVIGTIKGFIPLDITFFLAVGITAFGFLYYIFGIKKIPWTLSLPAIFGLAASALFVIYLVFAGFINVRFLNSLQKIGDVIFGSGIYGNKVSMTIAEANTYQISNTVMSFGPAIYWVGWAGLLMLFYFYYKDKMRRDYLFIILLFIINLWLTSTAGRFINDMVPLIAILSGGVLWFLIKKLDFRQMFRNIQSAGGGLRGLRKGIKLLQFLAVIFIAFVVILPNVFLVLDAAVPSKPYQKEDGNWTNLKTEIFGEGHSSAFGLSVGKEYYWVDAFNWLSEQDTDKEPEDRPAFISWWDYGFYEVAVGAHPTVADNFQDGIPPASNFHTATSEKEAVAVWITRLLEGHLSNNNFEFSDEVNDVLEKHLGLENKNEINSWVGFRTYEKSPSYGQFINEDYNKYFSDNINMRFLTVGAQWDENAFYHDMVDLLAMNESTALTDEEITYLYHDIQEATGYSIRYYGVEGYDKQIFNIFAFLSDKSLILLGAPEDQFVTITYQGQDYSAGRNSPPTPVSGNLEEYLNMSNAEKGYIYIEGTGQKYKDDYFNTMFYRTYLGPTELDEQGNRKIWPDANLQYPCVNMRHFYPEFISNLSNPLLRYPSSSNAAVVIAKYYEGAYVNGTVLFEGVPVKKNLTASIRKDLQYAPELNIAIDHDKQEVVGTDSDPNATGNFNLIAGAGGKLAILRNLELSFAQTGAFVVKEINFTGAEGTDYAPIYDEDAMRREGANIYRDNITVNIDPAFCNGFIYNDTDKDGKYNSSVDEAIEDSNVIFYEINEFDQQFIQQGRLQPNTEKTDYVTQATTDENGSYNISGVIPGWYVINAYYDDFLISQEIVPLYAGNFSYNLSMPEKSSLEGVVYYDSDFNNELNSNSDVIVDNANVELNYQTQFGPKTIANTTTDSNGRYSFTDIIPGQYTIKAESDKYQTEKSVSIDENVTKMFNVSMNLIPVEVSGTALYQDEGIEEVGIMFTSDETVENNTAVDADVLTGSDGSYTINLQPGSYNISLEKTINQGAGDILVYQSLNNSIELKIGQSAASKNFSLEKYTVTVSGTVTINGTVNYEGISREGIRVIFNNKSLVPAVYDTDENGSYIVEILPGEYSINVTTSNLTGQELNYSFYEIITVTESQIPNGYIKDIVLARDQDS